MKKCIILRGITGSGKSTVAALLGSEGGRIHSTDDYFAHNGEYLFQANLLQRHHEKNLEMFKRSIRAGVSPVILDNCNHRVAHFLPYIDFARIYEYEIEVIQMPHIPPELAVTRSKHKVPLSTVERMLQTWEPYAL